MVGASCTDDGRWGTGFAYIVAASGAGAERVTGRVPNMVGASCTVGGIPGAGIRATAVGTPDGNIVGASWTGGRAAGAGAPGRGGNIVGISPARAGGIGSECCTFGSYTVATESSKSDVGSSSSGAWPMYPEHRVVSPGA
jgi:hypothetical protein